MLHLSSHGEVVSLTLRTTIVQKRMYPIVGIVQVHIKVAIEPDVCAEPILVACYMVLELASSLVYLIKAVKAYDGFVVHMPFLKVEIYHVSVPYVPSTMVMENIDNS